MEILQIFLFTLHPTVSVVADMNTLKLQFRILYIYLASYDLSFYNYLTFIYK